jgi:predicted ATP-grasp superfamily ATP-dependent carboligase
VASSRGKPGIRWVRLISDLATGFVMIRDGNLDWRAYLRSLLSAHTEAVFSREDPLPGLTELALIPYLMVKRAF